MYEAMPSLDDALWASLQPLLPPAKPRRNRYPGRKPLEDRAVLAGILYVLETGLPWGQLPLELGYGSGMSCWRRLRDWQQAGVWEAIQAELVNRVPAAAQVDWTRVKIESRPKRSAAPEVRAAVVAEAAAQAAAAAASLPAGEAGFGMASPPSIAALAPAAVSAAPAPRVAWPTMASVATPVPASPARVSKAG